jgi:hypothetical protein
MIAEGTGGSGNGRGEERGRRSGNDERKGEPAVDTNQKFH